MSLSLIGMIAVISLSVLILGALGIGLYLVIRDTTRQDGKWGVNLKPTACTECGVSAPLIRTPTSWHQTFWGGWTCHECGLLLDKWGRPVETQNTVAKWAVLRAAEEVEDDDRRPTRRDKRIREANDQTKRDE
jgi:hypothetical protein